MNAFFAMERRIANEYRTTIEHVPEAMETVWVCVCAAETGLRVFVPNFRNQFKKKKGGISPATRPPLLPRLRSNETTYYIQR